jgi:hypothetical protein
VESSPRSTGNCFQPYLSGRHSHPLGRFASQEISVEEKPLSRFSKQPSYRSNRFITPSLQPFRRPARIEGRFDRLGFIKLK